ncbi:insulinase family protein [Apilactobacillus timberlakei]|uniref:EF-P 5-aminopentanol modification-associated protein YfmF n=1 Tax=Apilactobacillus timberlakei TaxID=2008380 RepID=UPI00112EDCB3|nr:pitrilysin family protein [Apilactobacillus timberlakei]TPR18531.1 insulinase family protein [Apilactobacillus timberlakei]TPR20378.1 insulinase family protein [Apilactobacillus timberlakei]TPR22141.1 insulinase family protein [Apilactobacillus timberlakei]
MQKYISNGVSLNTIHDDKFKTITITCDLIEPLNINNFEKRALLAEIFETNNADYPTQTKLARQLSKMYGASFGTNLLRYGNLSVIRINLSIPNPEFIPGNYSSLLKDAIQFLNSILMHPLTSNNAFNNDTFNLQKSNMQKYISSVADDKQYYASIKLKEYYYQDDINRGKFLFGDVDQYDKINSSDEYKYYQDVIKDNNIRISALGKFDDDKLISYINEFNFSDRDEIYKIDCFKHNENTVEYITENTNATQSNLNMAYNLPIYYDSDDFLVALLFNAIFGGSAQSKLFKNVREKYSMAYYANSMFNSLNGVLMVNSGIDANNAEKVQSIVNEQLVSIQNKDINLDILNSIKSEMITAKRSILDNPRQSLEQSFVNSLLNKKWNFEKWRKNIESINVDQIANVAKKVQLQTVFLLKGDKK